MIFVHDKPSIGVEILVGEGPVSPPVVEPEVYQRIRAKIEEAAPDKSDFFHHMLTRDVIGAAIDGAVIVDSRRMIAMGREFHVSRFAKAVGDLIERVKQEDAAHQLRMNVHRSDDRAARNARLVGLCAAGLLGLATFIYPPMNIGVPGDVPTFDGWHPYSALSGAGLLISTRTLAFPILVLEWGAIAVAAWVWVVTKTQSR